MNADLKANRSTKFSYVWAKGQEKYPENCKVKSPRSK